MSPSGLPRRAAGFSLLEAIVALVIFSMGALALYGWLGTNLRTLIRVQERRETTILVRSALDAVRRINPMATPSGQREIGDTVVVWDARPLEPDRPAVTQLGLPTIFRVGLFVLDVRVLRAGEEVERFQVRQVGYQQVSSLEEE